MFFFPSSFEGSAYQQSELFHFTVYLQCTCFSSLLSLLLLQSPFLKHLLLPPPLLFQICPLGFSCQHLSLSYSSCQYSFFTHPQIFLFTLRLRNQAVFFSHASRHRSFPLLIFYSQAPHQYFGAFRIHFKNTCSAQDRVDLQ